MGSLVQKNRGIKKILLQNSKKKLFRKVFEKKIWIDLRKNIFEKSSKTLSNISVPNFEAVVRC